MQCSTRKTTMYESEIVTHIAKIKNANATKETIIPIERESFFEHGIVSGNYSPIEKLDSIGSLKSESREIVKNVLYVLGIEEEPHSKYKDEDREKYKKIAQEIMESIKNGDVNEKLALHHNGKQIIVPFGNEVRSLFIVHSAAFIIRNKENIKSLLEKKKEKDGTLVKIPPRAVYQAMADKLQNLSVRAAKIKGYTLVCAPFIPTKSQRMEHKLKEGKMENFIVSSLLYMVKTDGETREMIMLHNKIIKKIKEKNSAWAVENETVNRLQERILWKATDHIQGILENLEDHFITKDDLEKIKEFTYKFFTKNQRYRLDFSRHQRMRNWFREKLEKTIDETLSPFVMEGSDETATKKELM